MTGALSIHFTAIVWRYESKGGWYFVSLPDEDSARIREMFKSQEQGWGRLKVEASFVRCAGRDARSERGISEVPDDEKRVEDSELAIDSNLTLHIAPFASLRAGSRASHKTAIWFDTKRNTYLLPIKAEIRNGEGIDEGDEVDVTVRI